MAWLNQDPNDRARLVGGAHSGRVLPIAADQERLEIGYAGEEEYEVYFRRPGNCVPVIFALAAMSDEEIERELRLIAARDAEKTARIEAGRAAARGTAPAALTWRDGVTEFSLTDIRLDRDAEFLFGDLYLISASHRLDVEFFFDRASAWNLIDLLQELESGAASEAFLECSTEPNNHSLIRFAADASGAAAVSLHIEGADRSKPAVFIVRTNVQWLMEFIRSFEAAVRNAYANPSY